MAAGRTIFSVLLLVLPAIAAQAADACRPTEVQPTGRIGDWRLISLGDADSTDQPTAWQGPIQLEKEVGHTCTVQPESGLLTRPFFYDKRSDTLFVSTYSGSNRQIEAIDLQHCMVRWTSAKFIGSATIGGSVLHTGKSSWPLGMDCLPHKR